jgi:hypothetical protein
VPGFPAMMMGMMTSAKNRFIWSSAITGTIMMFLREIVACFRKERTLGRRTGSFYFRQIKWEGPTYDSYDVCILAVIEY